MSSSQQHQQSSSKPPAQPRGLPGFLRRTFRNPYEQDVPESPTPVLPIIESMAAVSTIPAPPTSTDDDPYMVRGNSVDNVKVDGDSINNDNDSKGGSTKNESHIRSKSESHALEAKMNEAYIATPTKRHLRAVAFPPLPNERERIDAVGGDDSDSTNSLHSAKTASTTKTQLSTPSLPFDSRQDNIISDNASHNNNNNLPTKSYKEIQFETMLESNIIPLRDLRKLAWNGIPAHHRPIIWKILLGYLPANTSRHTTTLQRRRREYKDAIKQHYDIPDDSRTNSEQETLRQVLVDVPRTAPEVPLFHNDRVRRCLSRLLYIWAMRHPASSYVQGINDLATPLISVFLSGYFDGKDCLDGEVMADVTDQMIEEIEADTYWCLTNLLSGIQDHYTSDQPGMQRMVMHLEELVSRIDADLASHLKDTGIEFIQFAFKWMNCLLLREFKLPCVFRLWDTYFSEGDGGFENFHVYVCASFLVHFSGELQQMGFDELFQFMQNMPTGDWGDREIEILLSSAFVLSTLFGGSEAHLNVVRGN